MNFLSEATTIGLLLTLVFGALFFYLYSRVNYAEKRMGLMENILLDLKMSLDNGNENRDDFVPEPVGQPAPLEKNEVDTLPAEEEYYKNVIENVQFIEQEKNDEEESIKAEDVIPSAPLPVIQEDSPKKTNVSANYESMVKSELVALCEQRNIKVPKRPGRSDLIAALRKYDEGSSSKRNEPQGGSIVSSELFPMAAQLEGGDEGFPVDLGATEISE